MVLGYGGAPVYRNRPANGEPNESANTRRYSTMLGSPAGSMLRLLLPALIHVQCQGFQYSDPSLLDSTIAHGMVRIVCLSTSSERACEHNLCRVVLSLHYAYYVCGCGRSPGSLSADCRGVVTG